LASDHYSPLSLEKQFRSAKFGNRSNIGILVGYEGNTIYRIYDPKRGVIRASAVVFEEDSTPAIPVENDDSDSEHYEYEADGEAAQPLSPATNAAEAGPPKNDRESPNCNTSSVEDAEEDTIIVQRRRPIIQPQPPIMEEDNDQDEVDRQLQLQANTESNTQRGANTISRRSERIQRSADAR
jgi:hypothetical protein